MAAVLVALVAVLALGYLPAGWLVLRHLRDRDESDRLERAATVSQHQALIRGFADQVREAHQSRADEIATLLQRIQAPEVAVIQHTPDTGPAEATYPLSDEEAAERQMAIQRIEEMERAGMHIPEVISG